MDTGAEKTYGGTVMFPTTHDLTSGTAEAWVFKLRALIEAKNKVLIVSKAPLEIVNLIQAAALNRKSPHAPIDGWRERTELRVTLGTLSVDVARFWEPGAPTPSERLKAVEEVRAIGVTVSASMEPLLSPESAGATVAALLNAGVNGEIWIGCANKLRLRTAWCSGLPGLEAEIARLEDWQTPEAMREVYCGLKGHPQVRWKDSYQKALGIDVLGRPARKD